MSFLLAEHLLLSADFDSMLKILLTRGLGEVDGQKASAFVFDPADRRLKLLVGIPRIDSFEMEEGTGIAGQMLDRKKPDVWLAEGEDLADYRRAPGIPSDSSRTLFAILCVRIRLLGEACVVLCFDFLRQGDEMEKLSSDRKIAVQNVFSNKEIQAVREVLVRAWIQKAHFEIQEAGLLPNELRKRAAEFVTEFEVSLADKCEKPQALEIQLVDHRRDVIHTFVATDLPVGFESIAYHPLSSNDIQADMIRNRQPEMIAGFDKKRFNKQIFDELGQKKLTRLWIPLIPFHLSIPALKPRAHWETEVKNRIEWQPGEQNGAFISRVARWKQDPPPKGSAFGTFSISYSRKDSDEIDLSPFTDEMAYFCIQKAWELTERLYPAVLSGAVERIGRLSFSVGAAERMSLFKRECATVHCKKLVYPSSGVWRFAEPEKCTTSIASEPLVYEDAPLGAKPPPEIELIRKTTIKLAKNALSRAEDFYNKAMEVFELHDTSQYPDLLGTEKEDQVIEIICEDARREVGAEAARFYTFDMLSDETLFEKEVQLQYVTTYSAGLDEAQSAFSEELKSREQNFVENAASKTSIPPPVYCPTELPEYSAAVFPLKLADQSRGGLVLSFSKGEDLSENRKKEMEGRASRWIQRLSMHRLILSDRFSKIMANIRQEIGRARKDASSLNDFLENALKSTCAEFKAHGGMITVHSVPRASLRSRDNEKSAGHLIQGPGQLKRLVCWDKVNDSANAQWEVVQFEPIDRDVEGPCKEAVTDNRVVLWKTRSDEKYGEHAQKIAQELFKKNLEPAARWMEGLAQEEASMMTVPVFLREGRIKYQIALKVALRGAHVLRHAHEQQLLELGAYLGESVAAIIEREQKDIRDKYEKMAKNRSRKLADGKDQDALVGALFTGLGRDHLAEHAVLWVVGQQNDEIIARSWRGRGFSEDKLSPVQKRSEHPWFSKFATSPQNSDETNKWETLATDFHLWTIDLEDAASRSDYCRISKRSTDCRWMVTLPIIDAQHRFFGLMDLFCKTPLRPEEFSVVEEQFYRLSIEFTSAMERIRHQQLTRLELDLHAKTADLLRDYKTGEVHRTLVKELCKHMQCGHCDMFLKRTEKTILAATTRQPEILSREERYASFVPFNDDVAGDRIEAFDPLAQAMIHGRPIIRHKIDGDNRAQEGLSPELEKRLGDDLFSERLIVPILDADPQSSQIVGMLHFSEKKKHQGNKGRLKMSCAFSSEDLLEARPLARTLEPILRLVRVIDDHGVHVNAMVHSLGQPLQSLRFVQNDLIRLACYNRASTSDNELKEAKINLDADYKQVDNARERLEFLGRLYRPDSSPHFELTSLFSLVEEMVQIAQRRFGKVKFRIHTTSLPQLPLAKDWMSQAITNLLDNAAKYSFDRKTVLVTLKKKTTGRHSAHPRETILISVKNLGVGIPPQDTEHIFEPYFRSRVKDRKGIRPGSGLGLSIVKEAVNIHQGKIWRVRSEPLGQKGSELPAAEDIEYVQSYAGDVLPAAEMSNSIEDIPHLTTFTIELDRSKLEKLFSHQKKKKGGAND